MFGAIKRPDETFTAQVMAALLPGRPAHSRFLAYAHPLLRQLRTNLDLGALSTPVTSLRNYCVGCNHDHQRSTSVSMLPKRLDGSHCVLARPC
jgi:hypothetical protein